MVNLVQRFVDREVNVCTSDIIRAVGREYRMHLRTHELRWAINPNAPVDDIERRPSLIYESVAGLNLADTLLRVRREHWLEDFSSHPVADLSVRHHNVAYEIRERDVATDRVQSELTKEQIAFEVVMDDPTPTRSASRIRVRRPLRRSQVPGRGRTDLRREQ